MAQASGISSVRLVCLVHLVDLVHLVYLVGLVQANKQGRLTACFSILLAWIIHECRREAETEARRGFSQVRPT